MMKKLFTAVMLALLMTAGACTTGGGTPAKTGEKGGEEAEKARDNKLLGKWSATEDGNKMTFNFMDDGKMQIVMSGKDDGLNMVVTMGATYTQNGDKLNINVDTNDFNIEVLGDSPEAKDARAVMESPEMKKEMAESMKEDFSIDGLTIEKNTDTELVLINNTGTKTTFTKEKE